MANPMKGEAIARVDAGEFTLSFTFATAAAIEEDFGKSIPEIFQDMEKRQSPTDMMRLIYHGLRKHHDLTLEQVADVMTLAEVQIWGEALGKAVGMQPGDANAKGSGAARPPQAKAGRTGLRSSCSGSK